VQMPQFDELPFNARPDLTPYLIHLTKNTRRKDKYSALENLMNILREGEIWGSDSAEGLSRDRTVRRALWMFLFRLSSTFSRLKTETQKILAMSRTDCSSPRNSPIKRVAARCCICPTGKKAIGIPDDELWRVVQLEVTGKKWISWVHEREWRCRGSFRLPSSILAVLVKNTRDAAKLARWVGNEPDCKCKPLSIIPLTVVSQGLLRPS
jgi:hypothetical protein